MQLDQRAGVRNSCFDQSTLEPISQAVTTPIISIQSGGRMGNFAGHGAKCVKRRAALSVKANPNCADKADEYVEAAFERCYEDTYPFDRHPNLR